MSPYADGRIGTKPVQITIRAATSNNMIVKKS